MTETEFKQIIAAMDAGWGMKFGQVAMNFWWKHINHLDYTQASIALEKLVYTCPYPPTVATLMDAYRSVGHEDTAQIDAIGIIMRAVSQYGRYQIPEAMAYILGEDLEVYEIVRNIGFENICNGDINFLRPEIERLLKEIKEQQAEQELLPGALRSQIAQLRNRLIAQNNTLMIQGWEE